MLGAAVAAVPLLAPSAAGKTSQRDEETGWKRAQHAKKKDEEAGQPALLDKLLEDGWSVKVERALAGFQRLRDGAKMLGRNALWRVFETFLYWSKTGTFVCREGSASCTSLGTLPSCTRVRHRKGGRCRNEAK